MAKEILYINGMYCAGLESLKKRMRQECRDESFREELLTFYYDEVLQRWLMDYGCHIDLENISNHSDIECFKSLYQAIVGEPCWANLDCDFFKYAELVRAEIDGKSYPMQFDGPLWADEGEQISFVFKPKRLGNESFVAVLKSENGEITQLLPFHPESLRQEFNVSFSLNDISQNGKFELVVRRNCIDSVLCTLHLGYTKLSYKDNEQCYLKLYHLKDQKYFMTEVIKKDREQLNRIFGEKVYNEAIKSSYYSYSYRFWESDGFTKNDVEDVLRSKCLKDGYSPHFQYPSDSQIEDFLSCYEQYRGCTFVRNKGNGNFPTGNGNDTKKPEKVVCFSIREDDVEALGDKAAL